MTKDIAILSLGCDKNRLDTERVLYNLICGGHKIVDDYADAQILIVNTCAFIEAAKVEAIDSILNLAQYKNQKCEKLIVMGCLPQKYASHIKSELFEVDRFLGFDEYDNIVSIIEDMYNNDSAVVHSPSKPLLPQSPTVKVSSDEYTFNRTLSTPLHYAFLKVAEGCDNHCTFCTIPSIRGKYRSVKIEHLVKEAESLVECGVKEIILIAQDVTRYGYDIYNKSMLVPLIRQLTQLDLRYVRLMYCYPELVTDELLEEIDSNQRVAKYIDIPLQHVSDPILKLMNRRSTNAQIRTLINKIRAKKNHIAIRTTFMVGFPSETQSQFEELLQFVDEFKLDNVGVFAYSKESDTPSSKIKGQIPKSVKQKRVKLLGEAHLKNTIHNNEKLLGKVISVTYEDIDFDRNLFIGRTQYNSPEIDTVVYFSADFVDVGEMYDVKITQVDGYDLIGEKI